ncbi:uncharacterized protein [Rhodnius prolixus]|uniref:uncharacterized protein n=1 Tax=Rhodnius prolixus TaxID=13249 RepID=UPI003D189123
MDPKVTQHLIKTSKSLREKFKSLKRGLQLSQQDLERSLKPITKPLQELVEQNKKRSKKAALKSDASTSTTSLEEYVKLPLKEEEEVKLPLKASTPIPRKDVLDIKMEEETFEDDDSPLEQIKQIHSKEELEKSLEEVEDIGSLIKPYLLKHMTSDTKDLDDRYGIRVLPTGGMTIGNAQVAIEDNDINVNGNWYKGPPGLLQLLFLKKPNKYTVEDLENYKDILEVSNAHKQQFSDEKHLSSSKGFKYKNIIAPLFYPSKGEQSAQPYFTPPSTADQVTRTPRTTIATKPIKRRYGLRHTTTTTGKGMDVGQNVYEHWDDPNELVDRLRLLYASTNAGHTGHGNEIHSIIEELREADIIY